MSAPGSNRARRASLWTGLIAVGACLATPVSAHEELGRREGMDCRVCHVGPEGGPLTPVGRDYLWGGGSRLLSLGWEDEGRTDGRSQLGDWSGETLLWGRRGRERVLGQSQSSTAASGTLRLRADRFLGRDNWSFRTETYGQSIHESGPSGFRDDAVDLVDLEARWQDPDGSSQLRLGRHWVALGVGVNRVDGVSARKTLGRLDLDAYAGLPSDNALGGSSGDLLTGGRVGLHGQSWRAGVSTVYWKDESEPADGKLGLDLDWTPSGKLSASGLLSYDWIADEFYDSRLYLTWRPSVYWAWSAGYSRTTPGLFLPKNTIFSVFSLDEYEEASLSLTRRLTDRLSMRLFDQHTFYEDDSRLIRLGGAVDVRFGPGGEDRAGLEAGYQDEERHPNGATRVDGDALFLRGYHFLYWTRHVYTTTDVLLSLYSGNPYGRDTTVARLLVGWDARSNWDLQVGAEHYRTPEFSSRMDFVLRLTRRF